MSWYSRCSWCGGPFSKRNYRHYTNVSFGYEFSISNDETPNFSYPPSQPQTSSSDQFHCFGCGDPLEECVHCQHYTCKWCGYGLRKGFCFFCPSRDGNSCINDPNPNSFNDTPNIFTHPPQPQYETSSCELCGNDSHYGYDCPHRFPLVYEQNHATIKTLVIIFIHKIRRVFHNNIFVVMNVASILKGFIDEPLLEENDDLFDLESEKNEWKKILYDAKINDLMTEDKVFDPEIHEKFISLTYVSFPFEDRRYLFFTYVI
nr:hypothetical protein [Tanacetum cinerariifolium]